MPELELEHVVSCYRQYNAQLNLGHITFEDIWDAFCACVGKYIDPKILPDALREVPKNDAMFALAKSLRKNYMVGMITDNTQLRMQLIESDMHLSNLFDPIIISAAVHASKHDGTTKIFDAALAAAHCTAEEAVFIDNRKENLVVAAQMGIQIYFHDTAKNDMEMLRKTLNGYGMSIPSF